MFKGPTTEELKQNISFALVQGVKFGGDKNQKFYIL